MAYIYKITDKTNNKYYIGQAKDVFARWRTHCDPKSTDKMEISRQIQNKGVNNFTFEVIEIVEDEKADEAEIKWIAYYDSFYNGYNRTKGGKEHYLFMRLSFSKEELIEYWDNNPYKSCREVGKHFGVHHETVSKILKEYDRPIIHGKSRIVLKNELTGEIKEFSGRIEGAKYIKDKEGYSAEIRTIQKRLSDQLRYKHYTVIEYYKGEDEDIVHPH